MDTVELLKTTEYQPPAPQYSGAVAAYLHQSLADNTHRAYEGDLAHFRAWGGSIPTTSEAVAEYSRHYRRYSRMRQDINNRGALFEPI